MRFNQSTAIEQIQGGFYGRNVSTTISIGRRCCRGLESLRFVILRNRVLDISVNLRKEGSNVKVQKTPVLFFSYDFFELSSPFPYGKS